MSELFDTARRYAEQGDLKRALKTLWAEKVDAAARGDARRLEAVFGLAYWIAEKSSGRTQLDARSLASLAHGELTHVEAQGMEAPPSPVTRPGPRPAEPDGGLEERLTEFQRKLELLEQEHKERLQALDDELLELWALAAPEEREAVSPVEQATAVPEATRYVPWAEMLRPVPPGPEPSVQETRVAEPVETPAPAATFWEAATPGEPVLDRVLGEMGARIRAVREKPFSELFGAGALAWAGGLVTLLGIVFLFVLAVNRGWIGPEVRIGIGAVASVAVFLAGLYVRRRYGQLYAALGAVGAGVAGAYATLAAATAIYDFVPRPAALVVAGAIAAVGVVTSIAWSTQTIAGLGLIGAMIALPIIQPDVSVIGGAFLAVLMAATAVVAIWQRWRELLLVGGVVSAMQLVIVLAGAEPKPEWRIVALSGVFWLIYTATGIAYQLRLGEERLERLTATFVLSGVSLAFAASAQLFGGETHGIHCEGLALLVVALVQIGLGAGVLRAAFRQRDLSSMLWASGLTVAAVAIGELLTGEKLTLVWAAEAALLAWLAVRLDERRFQLASAAYLLLALGYTLFVDAAPDALFVASRHPASGVPSVVFVALAAALFARSCGRSTAALGWRARYSTLAELLGAFQSLWRALSLGAAALLCIYAVSLSLLELFEWAGRAGIETDFERGHVALSGLWSLLGLAGLVVGLRRHSRVLHIWSLAWLGVTLLEALAYDRDHLNPTLRSYSFLCVGGAVLLGGFLEQRLAERPVRLSPQSLGLLLASTGLLSAAIVELVDGKALGVDLEGLAFLGLALVYGAFGANVLTDPRQRELSTFLWATGLVFGAIALGELVSGVLLVLLWAVAGAALAWLSVQVRERRLEAASALLLLLAFGYAIILEAPPNDFFVASRHPAAGVPSVVFVVLAVLAFARYCIAVPSRHRSEHAGYAAISSALDSHQDRWRAAGLWSAGLLSLYSASLAILELFQWASGADVSTDFQRGHVAVSAFWALVALALLYLGLRGRRLLRVGGLLLFGLILAKIFLYDLSNLSSVARAFSFLAVGAVFLVSAFFYQRLSSQLDERRRDRSGSADPGTGK